jgi:L,D-peptidoglycan transpeptidase YkuD (ErfK/YbiS/YcfS/YnhG family)
MTITAKPRGRALAKAALLSPLALGLALGPAVSSMAAPAEEEAPQGTEDALVLEVPALEDLDIPGIGETTFETLHTWSLDTEVVTDISTDQGPIGTPDGEGDEGDGSTPAPTDEPTAPPTTEPTTPPTASPTPTEAPTGASCEVSGDVTADKVLVIDGDGGANASAATCEKDESGAYVEVETYDAKVGHAGIADAGKKVEGDGKTPSGTYSLGDGFGLKDKPAGFSGDWHDVNEGDVWIDGDASVEDGYNTLGNTGDGDKGESLNQSPAYHYAQVIEYNMDPVVAGAGSAIFLHVNTGSGATEGCVSLPESDLLDVFEWADEDTQIQIVK